MKKNKNSNLDVIVSEFNSIKNDNAKVSREKVLEWMKNDDIQVQGAVYSFCSNRSYYINIEPNLTAEDYYQFVKSYLKRCIIENPSGDWSETRYEAGWAFVSWFKSYWKDNSLPRHYVSELKELLVDIYTTGDEDIRLCISTAILEHLFDNKKISRFFSDWQSVQVLKQAYEDAMGCAGKIKGP